MDYENGPCQLLEYITWMDFDGRFKIEGETSQSTQKKKKI